MYIIKEYKTLVLVYKPHRNWWLWNTASYFEWYDNDILSNCDSLSHPISSLLLPSIEHYDISTKYASVSLKLIFHWVKETVNSNFSTYDNMKMHTDINKTGSQQNYASFKCMIGCNYELIHNNPAFSHRLFAHMQLCKKKKRIPINFTFSALN